MREQIGSYRIEKVLGQGGMGVVYKGRHDVLGRYAAIKTFLPGDATNSEQRKRFLREAQAHARLQHPNIVTVYDFFEDHGDLFIAMEYVEGKTLWQVLNECRGSRMRLEEALPIIDQVLAALEYVHSKNIIHRDVKPSNVMICNGVVKLMDFGLAFEVGMPRLTTSMRVQGTPQYMSPEQLQAKPIDHRTDVYSVAILLYSLLSGHQPFEAKDYLAQIHERVIGPPDLQTLVPDLPAGICRAISIALSNDPNDRFQTAADFREALRAGRIGFLPVAPESIDDSRPTVIADRGGPPNSPPPDPPQERSFRKWTAISWLAVFFTLLAGTAIVIKRIDRAGTPAGTPPQQQNAKARIVTLPPVIDTAPAAPRPNKPDVPPKPKTTPVFIEPKQPREDASQKRPRDIEDLRVQITRSLMRAETDIRIKQFDSALSELDGAGEKTQRYPEEFRAEAERVKTLRVAAHSGKDVEQKNAAWQARIADIEKDLGKGNWIEVQRFAQRVLDDGAPEPFAARARELLVEGVEGLRVEMSGTGTGTTTNEIVRKPSAPARKKP